MGLFFIPLALLTGLMMGFTDEVIMAGTMSACVVRFIFETVMDFLEAVL